MHIQQNLIEQNTKLQSEIECIMSLKDQESNDLLELNEKLIDQNKNLQGQLDQVK